MLREVLKALVLAAEAHSGHRMLGSILLLDDEGRHLLTGAAPSLPQAYNEAIHGIEIGPAVGSCGTAAYYGEPVFVSDIKRDPLWAAFAELALAHDLRACWSAPIRDGNGRVLGTFANYYREARYPTPADVGIITYLADAAAQAILRHRAVEPA